MLGKVTEAGSHTTVQCVCSMQLDDCRVWRTVHQPKRCASCGRPWRRPCRACSRIRTGPARPQQPKRFQASWPAAAPMQASGKDVWANLHGLVSSV